MKLKIIIVGLLVAVAAVGGIYYWHHYAYNENTNIQKHERTIYHCPMHPTYTSNKPCQ